MVNLHEKIEEIRKKPEHVRFRYAWISVAIFMTIIIAAWIVSLKASYEKLDTKKEGLEIIKTFDNIKNSSNLENSGQ